MWIDTDWPMQPSPYATFLPACVPPGPGVRGQGQCDGAGGLETKLIASQAPDQYGVSLHQGRVKSYVSVLLVDDDFGLGLHQIAVSRQLAGRPPCWRQDRRSQQRRADDQHHPARKVV